MTPRLRSDGAVVEYPAELRAEAARLRAEGVTYRQIQDALGIKKATLASWFTRRTFGPLPRPPRQRYMPTRWPPEVVEHVRDLRSQGMRVEDISAQLGVP